MANFHSLKRLLEHAQQQLDDSATKLARLNLKQQESEKTLKLLVDYRRSYQNRFMASAGEGIDPVEWRNYQAFIGKLDTAIDEQQKVVARSLQHTAAGHAEFHAHRRRLKSYGTLAQRHQLDHAAQLSKQEQRQQDEHTTNGISHRSRSR